MNCIFCSIAEGKAQASIVHQTPDVVAFRDANPQAPTHVLIVPRRHIETLSALTQDDTALAGSLTLAAVTVARELGLEASGYRLVANCGRGAGQSVWHLHYHLLGGRRLSWPPG